MVPTLLVLFSLSETLLFVSIIHWFGNIWKMLLFRRGLKWRLILAAGIPGTIASFIGASLSLGVSKDQALNVLGCRKKDREQDTPGVLQKGGIRIHIPGRDEADLFPLNLNPIL